jgi:methionine-R-sulfoxide reductase
MINGKKQYSILRQANTEKPDVQICSRFREGEYECVGCDNFLFDTKTKFNSGTGWPSFTDPAKDDSVIYSLDESHGIVRTEVQCASCGSHLGHVFEDGPDGKRRHCINSICLKKRI